MKSQKFWWCVFFGNSQNIKKPKKSWPSWQAGIFSNTKTKIFLCSKKMDRNCARIYVQGVGSGHFAQLCEKIVSLNSQKTWVQFLFVDFSYTNVPNRSKLVSMVDTELDLNAPGGGFPKSVGAESYNCSNLKSLLIFGIFVDISFLIQQRGRATMPATSR